MYEEFIAEGDAGGDVAFGDPSPIRGRFWCLMDGEVEDGSQARPVSSPEDYHRSSSETLLPPTTRYVKRCRNRARQPAMLLASPFEVSFLDSSEDY
jgi:hypothetical protein